MKIKLDTEFIAFKDGICNIFALDEDGKRIEPDKYTTLGFDNRVLGFKRYFEAAANQINVNRVIRIPQISDVDNYDYVEIGTEKYGVKLVQNIFDTNPPSIDLTLDKAR